MIKSALLFLVFFVAFSLHAQNEFNFENGKNKASIPFKFINNLIFIPIKVNGIELNFLLDSGVEETVLFSMDDKKNVNLNNIQKISLRGLGSQESIDGLKSTNNVLETHGLKSTNHLLYIVLDQGFNLSAHVGIPVNGIIGCNFFKNNQVEINYTRKKIFVYSLSDFTSKRLEKKFQKVPITIEKSKPYLVASTEINKITKAVKLLIDIGNSDAIWLFQNSSEKIQIPTKNFDDYLGQGFSGEVFGKRALISKFSFSKFDFHNPIVAFPDSTSTKNVKMVLNRSGSIGSEILRRFTIVFDYSNSVIYVKRNSQFNSPFNYNRTGIEVQHNGFQWINETIRLENIGLLRKNLEKVNEVYTNDYKYKLVLKPVYIISNIRNNSLAAKVGLQKDDIIVSVNYRPAYQFSLNTINLLLRPEEEKWLTLEIDRGGEILLFKLLVQNEL